MTTRRALRTDLPHSQARVPTERNPDATTVLAGHEQPIRPELQAACRRVVEQMAARLGWDDCDDVLLMLGLEDAA